MINPYETAVKISEEETARLAKLLFESFAKAYEDREAGVPGRPEPGRPVTVVETKCCASGDGFCEFLVETVK